MKKNYKGLILFLIFSCSTLFLLSTSVMSLNQSIMIEDSDDIQLESLVLGDVEDTISVSYFPGEMTFHNGEL